ncbi:unnamed protein product [Ectocarpus sp. 12 AP-2014]
MPSHPWRRLQYSTTGRHMSRKPLEKKVETHTHAAADRNRRAWIHTHVNDSSNEDLVMNEPSLLQGATTKKQTKDAHTGSYNIWYLEAQEWSRRLRGYSTNEAEDTLYLVFGIFITYRNRNSTRQEQLRALYLTAGGLRIHVLASPIYYIPSPPHGELGINVRASRRPFIDHNIWSPCLNIGWTQHVSTKSRRVVIRSAVKVPSGTSLV